MNQGTATDVYNALGVTRVINARGTATALGGSILSPKVQAAAEQANQTFVSIQELLEKAGQSVAYRLGVESAFLTSGCFAALTLSSASIIAGADCANIVRLPDTTGMKNEFLIQKQMRYQYDRCVTVAGGRLVEVGGNEETTAAQVAGAIGPQTAGILYPVHLEGTQGTLPLREVVSIAREKGIAVLADAAFQVYPLERLIAVAGSADLVCFSAKYMGGPNSVGFVCGRKPRVETVALHGFMAYEEDNRSLGRGYKLDRQEVVAAVVALQEWFIMNHQERFRVQEQRVQVLVEGLSGLPHMQMVISRTQAQLAIVPRVTPQAPQTPEPAPWIRLRVTLDEAALGKTAAEVVQNLRAGDPSVWVGLQDNTLVLSVHTLNEGEERLVVERLRAELQS